MAVGVVRRRVGAVFLAIAAARAGAAISADQRIDFVEWNNSNTAAMGAEALSQMSYQEPILPQNIPEKINTSRTEGKDPKDLGNIASGDNRLAQEIQNSVDGSYNIRTSLRKTKKDFGVTKSEKASNKSKGGGVSKKSSKKGGCEGEEQGGKREKKNGEGKGDQGCSPARPPVPDTDAPQSPPTPSPIDMATEPPTTSLTLDPTARPSASPEAPTGFPEMSTTSLPTPTAAPTASSTTTSPTESTTTFEPSPTGETIQPTLPEECIPSLNQCCETPDCPDGSSCQGRQCVIEGALRFTLSWYGNSDLNLGVQAPGGGNPINAANPYDPISGGRLQQDVIPDSLGYWAENVYFLDGNVTTGQYLIEINTKFVNESRIGTPPADNEWTLTLNREGEQLTAFVGNQTTKILGVYVENSPEPCDPSLDACCSDSDCQVSQVCDARNCVEIGQPRFTLSWYGRDDKDIIVTTPFGVDIYYDNPEDPESGGRLQEDVVPDSIGFHVESIYFPPEGTAPQGIYEYIVRAGGEEPWNVTVALNDVIVEEKTGFGDEILQYQFGEIPSPTTPAPTPFPNVLTPAPSFPESTCSPSGFECCVNEDCTNGLEIQSCANRNCVTDGMPRFSLKWTGSGDIDLRVRTPDGTLIYFLNPFDLVSGGVMEEDVVPSGFGYYVENIYFPEGPDGTYFYGVSGSNEEWELDVYMGDELVEQHQGIGLSPDFAVYIGECDATSVACCTGNDCGSDEFDCANQNCVMQGNLRFSLRWEGMNDKDLFVTTPDGFVIGYNNPVDEVTGGTLEYDAQPEEAGRWVESIYFPTSRALTPGIYQYQVSSNGFEAWILEIFVYGELVTTTTGLTDSGVMDFELSEEMLS